MAEHGIFHGTMELQRDQSQASFLKKMAFEQVIKISPIAEGEKSKREKNLLKYNALSKSILHFN